MSDIKNTTTPSVEDRVKALETKRSLVDEKQRANVESLRKTIVSVQQMLKSVNVDTVGHKLDSMAENMRRLDRRQQVMVLRVTVATELTHFARNLGGQNQAEPLSQIIIRAFDNSDEWWFERRGLTIKNWAQALIEWFNAGAVIVTDAQGAEQ